MAPYDIASHLGVWAENLSYLGVGFCFGFILERAGFGDSRKLASQFYLHDMTVLKVMFTAIIVAMVLTFWAAELQLLDFSRVFVNPTYLGSGILGGLILGLGFIIGGYCPGTALVAAATFKLDGMFFLAGVLAGIALFGEAAPLMWGFFQQAGSMGRFTLPDWLGLDAGLVVLLVVLLALAMFAAGEWLERWARAKRTGIAPAQVNRVKPAGTPRTPGGILGEAH
jgi:hypothetical protein